MANSRQAQRETIETGHAGTRGAANQASQASRAISGAAEGTAWAGGEAFRRNAQSIGKTWQKTSQATTRIAERSMDQFSKLFWLTGYGSKETMRQSAGGIQALVDSSSMVVGGFQRLSGEWVRFVHDRIEENLEHFEGLLNCRTPQECMSLQTRIVRNNLEALLLSARRTAELSTKLVDEALRKMGDTTLAPR